MHLRNGLNGYERRQELDPPQANRIGFYRRRHLYAIIPRKDHLLPALIADLIHFSLIQHRNHLIGLWVHSRRRSIDSNSGCLRAVYGIECFLGGHRNRNELVVRNCAVLVHLVKMDELIDAADNVVADDRTLNEMVDCHHCMLLVHQAKTGELIDAAGGVAGEDRSHLVLDEYLVDVDAGDVERNFPVCFEGSAFRPHGDVNGVECGVADH